jgi:prepilin signal peptidase PulO-like enzyme (type II secretory pathway)
MGTDGNGSGNYDTVDTMDIYIWFIDNDLSLSLSLYTLLSILSWCTHCTHCSHAIYAKHFRIELLKFNCLTMLQLKCFKISKGGF